MTRPMHLFTGLQISLLRVHTTIFSIFPHEESLFEVLNTFVSLKRLIGIIVQEDSATVGYYDML